MRKYFDVDKFFQHVVVASGHRTVTVGIIEDWFATAVEVYDEFGNISSEYNPKSLMLSSSWGTPGVSIGGGAPFPCCYKLLFGFIKI